jgi:hypothetical protein
MRKDRKTLRKDKVPRSKIKVINTFGRTEGTCSLARMRAAASEGTAGQTAGLGHGNMLNAAL